MDVVTVYSGATASDLHGLPFADSRIENSRIVNGAGWKVKRRPVFLSISNYGGAIGIQIGIGIEIDGKRQKFDPDSDSDFDFDRTDVIIIRIARFSLSVGSSSGTIF